MSLDWRKFSDEQWLRVGEGSSAREADRSRPAAPTDGRGRGQVVLSIIAPLLMCAAYLQYLHLSGCIAETVGGESEIKMKCNHLAIIAAAAANAGTAHAQSIEFTRTTDTVRLTHDVPATAEITIEARIWIDTISSSWGFEHALWREQKNSLEDKSIFACSRGVWLYLAPVVDVRWEGGLPLGRWTHIACQQSNGETRIWVDGVLKQTSASNSNTIAAVPGSSNSIGAGFHNDSFVVPGAMCRIDWLRVSTCARYGPGEFTPPSECEILPPDSCAALVFTFDEPTGSTTLMNHGFVQGVASVGSTWIPGATSPVLVGASADANGNGVPDACEAPPCLGDLDASGTVTGVDLAIVLQNWGVPSSKYPGADIDGDGLVGGTDLSIVLSNWGACP